MAIMKPKTTTPTVTPSAAAYQKRLEKDVANFKPVFENYVKQKSAYDSQKKAFDSWQTALNQAQDNYNRAVDTANKMGYWGAVWGYADALNQVRNSKPAFTATNPELPTAPAGTKIQDNKLSYFDPSKYGLSGIYAALNQVKKAGEPSAITGKPRDTFDITQLYRNASDYATIDLSKLGDLGGVLAAVSGAGSTGKTYIPKSALTTLAKDYAAYGLGDINAAITGENAWETMQSPLTKLARLPAEMKLTTPEDEAKKAAADKALADWSAQKTKWTSEVYDPYQSNLTKYKSQFTDEIVKDRPGLTIWPTQAARDIPGYGRVRWYPTSGSSGAWYAQTPEGYQKLNPTGMGAWKYAFQNSAIYPNLMYQEPIFTGNPGAAPTFTVPQPEAYVGPSLEHVYAESIPQASGGTSASNPLGQLLRKTHQASMGGVQNPGIRQALSQQLYGSGGLSTAGRLLEQGTGESFGGISNPMLRGMLSKQLYG